MELIPRDVKKQNQKVNAEDNNYFKGHHCFIPETEHSKYKLTCSPWLKYVFSLTAVNNWDVRARYLFRSHTALEQEIYRQYKFYPYSIHPYSKLRFWLENLAVITLILMNTSICLFYCTNNPVNSQLYQIFLKLLESFYVIIIVANFFTGYIKGNTSQYVILDIGKTAWRYFTTFFLLDLLPLSGMFTFMTYAENSSYFFWVVLFDMMQVLRTPALIRFTGNLLTAIRAGLKLRTTLEVTLLLYTYLIWNIYFQFAIEYTYEGTFTPMNPRNCSWITNADVWNKSTTDKLTHGFQRAVAMLIGNSNNQLESHRSTCYEYFYVISWIISKTIVAICAFKYTIAMLGLESARSNYIIMTQQVKIYMAQRKFPPRLKKKILKFYSIRFQSHFFVESRLISCMTGQLREDIIMHSGRQLVSDVECLKTLPRSLLLQIGLKLTVVVFIAGDIIFKIHSSGDCLYFIDKGTVAIYSESGKEVCHLYDGDFFGEIALVMEHNFRTASVVAVSNCELFRLDKADFESSIACYPTVYEEIKKVAINRFDQTRVMDEHYRTESKQSKDDKYFE